jgi:hypothetical protein
MIELNNYIKKISTSQKGEDGILDKIFSELNISSGYFCEFGAGDGISNCNTFFLKEKGWQGLYIEPDENNFKNLKKIHEKNNKIHLINNFVSLELNETLDDYLNQSGAPTDFDLLSIDIDGNDLWVWDSLKNYKPKVVIVEYNSQYPSTSSVTVSYDKNHKFNYNDFYGASAGAFNKLAESRDYSLVAYTVGLNLIFIRNDLNNQKFKKYNIADIPIHIGWGPSTKKLVPY